MNIRLVPQFPVQLGINLQLLLLVFLCVTSIARWSTAEPFVECLDRPVVTRGQTQRLTVLGAEVDRPLHLWTSLPPGSFQAVPIPGDSSSQATFEVAVSKNCPLGIYGLRLATEDGLSNLCLFLVDDIVPTNASDQSRQTYPISIAGQFPAAGAERHTLAISSGQKLTFDVVASRLGTDADPLVTIYDASGRKVVQRDNDPGLFFDCCFEHQFEKAGIYTVEIRDARFFGSPHWRYVLRIGQFPAVSVAVPATVRTDEKTTLYYPELPGESQALSMPNSLPSGGFFHAFRRAGDQASNWIPLVNSKLRPVIEIEPNPDTEHATPAGEAPVSLHGVLLDRGDRDQFLLDLKQGEKIVIRAETRPLNSPADLELALFDPTGREVQRVDDVTLPGNVVEDATIIFTASKAGPHRLQVREATDQFGPQFTYRIEVQPNVPRFQLSSPASAFAVPRQNYQRLPVTVTRTDYNGPIELSLVDAPPGVTLEPHVIPEKETLLQCRISASADAPLGVYQFRIVGKAESGETIIESPVVVQPMVDRQLVNVDLIKYALRDNQRWLPASVTSCLALQITPPAPLSVELADAVVTLPRYGIIELPIVVNRQPNFDAPIKFTAAGGQLGEESQGRRQVFGRFPVATRELPTAIATIHSRSQANEAKELVELSAVAKDGARSITFMRSFLLDVRPVFSLTLNPPSVVVEPGGRGEFQILVERIGGFSGPVAIEPTATPGISLPEKIDIAAQQSSVDVQVQVDADMKPGKRRIRLPALARVNGFQEEPRPLEIEIDVKLPPPPAKQP